VLAALAPMSGCVNRLMNEFDDEGTFDALAISPSGDTLVVLGPEFDCVLTPPRPLVAVLHSERRPGLAAEFLKFELTSNTDLRGE
jgi:hypothetical protein